jgi:sugar (pentulose or hexulose) kinase
VRPSVAGRQCKTHQRTAGGRARHELVGKAIAQAFGLDIEDKAAKAKVVGLLKIWLGAGSLVTVERIDEQRRPTEFIEVAEDPT